MRKYLCQSPILGWILLSVRELNSSTKNTFVKVVFIQAVKEQRTIGLTRQAFHQTLPAFPYPSPPSQPAPSTSQGAISMF